LRSDIEVLESYIFRITVYSANEKPLSKVERVDRTGRKGKPPERVKFTRSGNFDLEFVSGHSLM
jgi:hypothetical protein